MCPDALLRYGGAIASAIVWAMPCRKGFTLIEVAFVLTLLGILLGLAVPRMASSLDGIHAAQAAARIALAHGRARATALGEQQVARVLLTGDSLLVLVGDSVRWRVPGPSMDGATLDTEPDETSYAPNGLAMGAANARYVVTRGGARVEIFVSRLGRVRIVRSAA